MATVTITCPECDKQIKAPDEVLGKKIRCKGCGATFAARADEIPVARPVPKAPKPPVKAAKPAPKAKPKEDDDEDANPYGVTDLDTAPRCPNCANELESADAVICLHCGYNTVSRERARTRKVRDVTGFQHFLWLLPGILCALLFFGLIGGIFWMILDGKDRMEQEEGSFYQKAVDCFVIWYCIFSLFGMFYAGRFAIRRLILNPTPPEVEE